LASSTIDVNSSLLSYAGVATSGAATATGAATALETSFNSLTEAIAPLVGQPIIGPGATALLEAVNTLAKATRVVFTCIGTDLEYMGPAMQTIYTDFATTDKNLQALFQDLNSRWAAETNFTVSSSLPFAAPTPNEQNLLSQILSGQKLPIPMTTVHVNVTPQGNPWKLALAIGLGVVTVGLAVASALQLGLDPITDAATAATGSADAVAFTAANSADTVVTGADVAAVSADAATSATTASSSPSYTGIFKAINDDPKLSNLLDSFNQDAGAQQSGVLLKN